MEEFHLKTIKNIIAKYKLDNLDSDDNLFTLINEFYKITNTFSVFKNSSDQRFINAINKVKAENDKKKKARHFLLKVDPDVEEETDYENLLQKDHDQLDLVNAYPIHCNENFEVMKEDEKQAIENQDKKDFLKKELNNIINLESIKEEKNLNENKIDGNRDFNRNSISSENFDFSLINNTIDNIKIKNAPKLTGIDKELSDLGKDLDDSRRKEMDFYNKRHKKWELHKEQDNIKLNANEKENKSKEEKLKNFFINSTLKELSMKNKSFEKLIELLRMKKQKNYEKDVYITDEHIDISNVMRSPITWIASTGDDQGSNLMDVALRSSLMIKEKNKLITDINKNKNLRRDTEIIEYGQAEEVKYSLSRAWNNFKIDHERFTKDLYSL